jgi:hypothetical protein
MLRLSFADHVNHFDPTEDRASAGYGLESEHRSNPPLNRAMILFDAIIEVSTLPDPDWLEPTP